jgi:hypothetical protein
MAFNKNEQQDAKHNAELQGKRTKTSWKTFEETNKRLKKTVNEGATDDNDNYLIIMIIIVTRS